MRRKFPEEFQTVRIPSPEPSWLRQALRLRAENRELCLCRRGWENLFNGFGNCFDIVAVDRADDVPVIGFETFANVFAEPVFDLAVDGNTVVIVQSDEFVEFPNTGQRADFVRNAFHQAAVT